MGTDTPIVRMLLTFPQVDVNFCLNGKTPIMNVDPYCDDDDEQLSELYGVLIKAGALKYSKSNELWYDLLSSECFIENTAIVTF